MAAAVIAARSVHAADARLAHLPEGDLLFARHAPNSAKEFLSVSSYCHRAVFSFAYVKARITGQSPSPDEIAESKSVCFGDREGR
jgi:hypothetical protein